VAPESAYQFVSIPLDVVAGAATFSSPKKD
jgi:hypothetical protein